ncbi:MAG: hypothetical protein O3B47_00945 [bacterium]|nr:hypothetical protein [bacterium]
MPDSFKDRLKQLPLMQKFILIGSALTVIGVFLPWYKDIDRFNIGDSFLGITGPLYLAGFLVLLAGMISLGLIVTQLRGKALPKLPLSERYFHVFNGVLSLLMLILAASVYFHPKFGINLTDKTAGIGMIFGFIGSAAVLLCAIMIGRTREVSFEQEGHLEPLIDMTERQQSPVKPETRVSPESVFEDMPIVDKSATVGDAIEASRIKEGPGNAWGPVQESINNYRSDKRGTNDIQ